jgi:hypothetical protein
LASAYTPGLTVSGDIVVRRTRRLPIEGDVLVKVGDAVGPDQTIAEAVLPGVLQTIKLSDKLGVEPRDVTAMSKLKPGDKIEKGQMIAETKGLFGMFKSSVASDFSGTVDSINEVSGSMYIREPGIPIGISAYVQGHVVETMPNEGAIIETRCAMIQGIFGVGGERTGVIRLAVKDAQQVLEPSVILATDAGKVLVGGSGMSAGAIRRAVEVGAAGIIAGGIRDEDLIAFLGYDIGVAITGTEQIGITLLVTEGFGYLGMADRTFALLKTLEGRECSLNGATQIRAGVIRPEILAPIAADTVSESRAQDVFELKPGAAIRVIREPYFGALGTVTGLPSTLQVLESGTEVRVLTAKLADGREVTVPRANVEITASA